MARTQRRVTRTCYDRQRVCGSWAAPDYCDTVAELGFNEPSDIQQAAIPEVLALRDLLGIAQTGTGKTAAFGLPLLQNLVKDAAKRKGEMRAKPRHPRALILARPGNCAANSRRTGTPGQPD